MQEYEEAKNAAQLLRLALGLSKSLLLALLPQEAPLWSGTVTDNYLDGVEFGAKIETDVYSKRPQVTDSVINDA